MLVKYLLGQNPELINQPATVDVDFDTRIRPPIWHTLHNNTSDGVALLDLLVSRGAELLASDHLEYWDGILLSSYAGQRRTAMAQWLVGKGVPIQEKVFAKFLSIWCMNDEATETTKLLSNVLGRARR